VHLAIQDLLLWNSTAFTIDHPLIVSNATYVLYKLLFNQHCSTSGPVVLAKFVQENLYASVCNTYS